VLECVDDVDERDAVAMSALGNDDVSLHTASSYVDAVRDRARGARSGHSTSLGFLERGRLRGSSTG
jgi:hypothetical protein